MDNGPAQGGDQTRDNGNGPGTLRGGVEAGTDRSSPGVCKRGEKDDGEI